MVFPSNISFITGKQFSSHLSFFWQIRTFWSFLFSYFTSSLKDKVQKDTKFALELISQLLCQYFREDLSLSRPRASYGTWRRRCHLSSEGDFTEFMRDTPSKAELHGSTFNQIFRNKPELSPKVSTTHMIIWKWVGFVSYHQRQTDVKRQNTWFNPLPTINDKDRIFNSWVYIVKRK